MTTQCVYPLVPCMRIWRKTLNISKVYHRPHSLYNYGSFYVLYNTQTAIKTSCRVYNYHIPYSLWEILYSCPRPHNQSTSRLKQYTMKGTGKVHNLVQLWQLYTNSHAKAQGKKYLYVSKPSMPQQSQASSTLCLLQSAINVHFQA